MSPEAWIGLATLVIAVLAGAGGFIWWAAGRDAQAKSAEKAQDELKQSQAEMKTAMVNLTDAMKQTTAAIGSLEHKLESYQKRTEEEHKALWNRVDWMVEKFIEKGKQGGEMCDGG